MALATTLHLLKFLLFHKCFLFAKMTIPQNLRDAASGLKQLNVKSGTTPTLSDYLRDFLNEYDPLGWDLGTEDIWYRARKCEGGVPFNDLYEMIYTPAPLAKIGRANFPNQSIHYAAWNKSTALDEIGAQTGDLIQLIAVRLRQNANVIATRFGVYQELYSTGQVRYAPNLAIYIKKILEQKPLTPIFIDSVLTEELRDPNSDYLVTSTLANLHYTDESGLIFPSVRNFGGLNLAVPAKVFDSKFEVLFTEVVKISDSFGYGLYHPTVIGRSCDFSQKGNINWGSKKELRFSFAMHGGLKEDIRSDGWQVKQALRSTGR